MTLYASVYTCCYGNTVEFGYQVHIRYLAHTVRVC